MRYADPERCPDCRSTMAYGAERCPSCGLSLEGPAARDLFLTLSTADALLERLRRQSASPAAAAPPTPGPLTSVRTLVPVAAVARGLAGASVPRILLGLGALCLLVAALVFLAVAWSAMGVAGRTATLLGFTGVAAALSAWAAVRELRAASETMAVVALGLLTFDVFGARSAGWLGDPSLAEFLVVLGGVVLAVGAAAAVAVLATPVRLLRGAEAFAAAGLATAAIGGVATEWLPFSAGVTAAVLAAAAVAVASRVLHLTVLAVAAAATAGVAWTTLALSSLDRAVAHPDLRSLWLDLEVWPLVVAAGMAVALAPVRRLGAAGRQAALGTGITVGALVVLAPVVDETPTDLTTAAMAVAAGLAVLAWVTVPSWRAAVAVPAVLVALPVAAVAAVLAGGALARIGDAGQLWWAGSAGGAFDPRMIDEPAGWLLPPAVAVTVLALAVVGRAFGRADRAVAPLLDLEVLLGVTAATAALTPALYAVPIWSVLTVLLAAGAAFTVRALLWPRALRLMLTAGFLGTAVLLSLHAQWLTLAALLVVAPAAVLLHLRSRSLLVAAGAGVVAAAATAGLVWTGSRLAVTEQWAAVTVLLVLALMTLGAPYVDEPLRRNGPAGHARLGTELGALVAALLAGAAAVVTAPVGFAATWAAVYLTLAGASVSALALLRADRRAAGWLGGALLVAASWVRLADVGVAEPEAYTLPAALALLAVGGVRLRRDPAAHTSRVLTPGLLLALVPSLAWVLAEPLTLRALLLGAACLLLVVGGAQLRWSAPLVNGAVVGSLVVLRHVTPLADAVPRWALIGTAGALLVALGITWEQRLRDARAVAGYVRALR